MTHWKPTQAQIDAAHAALRLPIVSVDTLDTACAVLDASDDFTDRRISAMMRAALAPDRQAAAMAEDFGHFGEMFAAMQDGQRHSRAVLFVIAGAAAILFAALIHAEPMAQIAGAM